MLTNAKPLPYSLVTITIQRKVLRRRYKAVKAVKAVKTASHIYINELL